MIIEDSLDEKNKVLFDELKNAGIQIDFEIHEDFKYWAVQPYPKYVIAANSNTPNPEMLAHELLHIKMEQLGFFPTHIIVKIFDPRNNSIDSKEFPNLQNLIEHLRMLPLFVALGYQPEKFLSNYGNDFFINELVPSLASVRGLFDFNSTKGEKPSIELITEFLSLVICLKDFEMQNKFVSKPFDTTLIETELKSADKALFEALYTTVTSWVDSNSVNNYALYSSLNYQLFKLGYPTEAGWDEWIRT